MELMTVGEVSKTFGVSTRMLRYYEKAGLLQSTRRADYAYRIYDEAAIRRLKQIIILRKLRIPLKQIAEILDDPEQEAAMRIFQEQISEIDEQITALSIVRSILRSFIYRNRSGLTELLEDRHLTAMTDWLEPPKQTRKETYEMNELNQADRTMNEVLDPRILLLPPFTAASYHYIGENPEEKVGAVLDKFIRESGLYEEKPDSRAFGFNHPNPAHPGETYGYEFWVTIPEDMEVPQPLVKKRFQGGLYAAHTIRFPEFHRWLDLIQWAEESEQYMPNYSPDGDEIMGGCLEEHLNWVYASHMGWPEPNVADKLDLLLPVKSRES